MSKCKCTMSISVLGDGCRYCQPQEYIDRLQESTILDRTELAAVEQELADLKAAIGEPVAWAARNTRNRKFSYIWHEEDDVDGWINLQHQSNDSLTYYKIPLYAKAKP